jgi:hypothetical protein
MGVIRPGDLPLENLFFERAPIFGSRLGAERFQKVVYIVLIPPCGRTPRKLLGLRRELACLYVAANL